MNKLKFLIIAYILLLSINIGYCTDDIDAPDEGVSLEYQQGDTPYVIVTGSLPLAYNVLHSNGHYAILSRGQWLKYMESYAANTGISNYSEADFTITADMYYMMMSQTILDSAENKDFAKLSLSTEIYYNDMSELYDKDLIFDLVEYEGQNYYVFSLDDTNQFYRVSPDTYTEYMKHKNDERVAITKEQYTSSYRTFGFGELFLHIKCGGSLIDVVDLKSESLYVTFMNDTNEEFTVIVNPPNYNTAEQLNEGNYIISSVISAEYPEYPLSFDRATFTIADGQTTELDIEVYREQDNIRGSGYTEEQIQESIDIANAEQELSESSNNLTEPVVTNTDQPEQPQDGTELEVPVDKTPMYLSVLKFLGIVALILLISGSAYWVYKNYFYD